MDPAIFQQRPTYRLFFALLDNYHAQTGTAEHFSQAENREMTDFLDAVCQTPCVQYVRQQLYQMWFQVSSCKAVQTLLGACHARA